MTYKHYIVVMAEPNCTPYVILDILNKYTEFGQWDFAVKPHPMMATDQWWFYLNSTIGFTASEIASIIDDICDCLDYELWHIALNNVGDYEVQP